MTRHQLQITRGTIVLALTGVCAAGVWLWRIADSTGFNPQCFQHVELVETTITDMRQAGDGFLIKCRVSNHGSVEARNIVLTARLIDRQGHIIMTNPLIGVDGLSPGESRLVTIRLASPDLHIDVKGEVQTTLVRWTE